jgi:hypothetical protein
VAFEADELEPPLRALAEANGWKAGDLFMAIRVALTGARRRRRCSTRWSRSVATGRSSAWTAPIERSVVRTAGLGWWPRSACSSRLALGAVATWRSLVDTLRANV